MDRRSFIKSSLVAGSSALFASRGLGGDPSSPQEQIPGAITTPEIDQARFPAFLCDCHSEVVPARDTGIGPVENARQIGAL